MTDAESSDDRKVVVVGGRLGVSCELETSTVNCYLVMWPRHRLKWFNDLCLFEPGDCNLRNSMKMTY